MEAKELRIGNYIWEDYGGVDQISSIINNGEIRCIRPKSKIEGQYYIKYVSPIPLTEEWLVKFNINEYKNQDVCRTNYVSYHKGNNTYNYCIYYYYDEQGNVDNEFIEVEYVHQLQNLHFALKKEELTIKVNH